jgi:hypothetical protein
MDIGTEQPQAPEKKELIQQNPEKLDNLLKFLVQIVMHKSEMSE